MQTFIPSDLVIIFLKGFDRYFVNINVGNFSIKIATYLTNKI